MNINDDYFAAIAVDHINKRFTITSRSESSHNKRQGSIHTDSNTGRSVCVWGHWRGGVAHPLGNNWTVLAKNLNKKDSRFIKEQVKRTWESLGYTYHPVFDEGDKE